MRRWVLLRLLAAIGLVTAGTLAVSPPPANAASACYNNPSPGNCDGSPVPGSGCNTGSYYVVLSEPLKNVDTGQYSWNYGYLQLWWSDHCQTNWGRLVINQSGTWDFFDQIFNPQFGYSYFYGAKGPGAYYSPMLYAPNDPACAHADIFVHSTGHYQFVGIASQFSPPC